MGLKLNLPNLGCPATSVNLRKDVSPLIADQVAVPKWNRTGFLLLKLNDNVPFRTI